MMNKRNIVVLITIIVVVPISFLMWKYSTPAPFTMEVICRPRNPSSTNANIMAIAEQKCVFLVTIEDGEGLLQGSLGLGEAIDISVSDQGVMANITVYPQAIIPGQIAEIIVIPNIVGINETLTVTITGERHGLVQSETVTIEVIPGEDGLSEYAAEMCGMFIHWLVKNHPELGITNDTEWSGTIVNPRILVVMHYIFYSDDWEVYLTWHVTMPPHDWTRIYLRRRFSETRPSYAFEISSVTAQDEPHSIEVPDWV